MSDDAHIHATIAITIARELPHGHPLAGIDLGQERPSP